MWEVTNIGDIYSHLMVVGIKNNNKYIIFFQQISKMFLKIPIEKLCLTTLGHRNFLHWGQIPKSGNPGKSNETQVPQTLLARRVTYSLVQNDSQLNGRTLHCHKHEKNQNRQTPS